MSLRNGRWLDRVVIEVFCLTTLEFQAVAQSQSGSSLIPSALRCPLSGQWTDV